MGSCSSKHGCTRCTLSDYQPKCYHERHQWTSVLHEWEYVRHYLMQCSCIDAVIVQSWCLEISVTLPLLKLDRSMLHLPLLLHLSSISLVCALPEAHLRLLSSHLLVIDSTGASRAIPELNLTMFINNRAPLYPTVLASQAPISPVSILLVMPAGWS